MIRIERANCDGQVRQRLPINGRPRLDRGEACAPLDADQAKETDEQHHRWKSTSGTITLYVPTNSTGACVYEIAPSQLQPHSVVILDPTSSLQGVPDDEPSTDSTANDFGGSKKRWQSSEGAQGGDEIDDAHATTVRGLDSEASGHWDG